MTVGDFHFSSIDTKSNFRVNRTNMKAARPYVMTARAAKAAATRARIRAAAIALYTDRPIEDVTLEEVARRAQTTVQTLLRAFVSKEELVYQALDDVAATGVPLKETPPGDVAAAVAAFHDIYEAMGDLVIQRLADEHRRPALKPGLEAGRRNHRAGVEAAFAPQLARVGGDERSRLVTILITATDVYVWKLLRRDMALNRTEAEAIVCRIIEGVTLKEEADGEHTLVELVGRRQPAA
jgi:AcrR family transcriptional regulator